MGCELAETAPGQESFDCISGAYEQDVRQFRADVQRCGAAMDNAFAFVHEAFGDGRELAVLVAELTGHSGTSRFISAFGNDAYYAHNASVQTQANRNDLLALVATLDLEEVG